MSQIVSVNPNGNMVGLNFTMAFPLKTSALSRGVYVIDRYNDGVFFTKEEYAPRTVHNTTYQLPMSEYGV